MLIRSIQGRRRLRWLLLVGLLLVLLFLLAFGILYQRIDSRSQIERAEPADVIIVLGAQVWPGERPSPALAARTRHAIRLYHSGYAPNLILTGGVGTYPPAEAEIMRRLAISANIPNEALVLDDKAYSTQESMVNAKEIMDAHRWTRALIVSDPFHVFRAETMARDLGIVPFGSPASDSPTFTITRLRVWYTAREALALVWYYGDRALGRPAWLLQLLKSAF